MSSTGRCFDIGNTVRHALHEFQRTGEPFFPAEQTSCRQATARSCDWRLFHCDGRIRLVEAIETVGGEFADHARDDGRPWMGAVMSRH